MKIEPHNARVRDVLKEFRIKLEYYLYETYAHIIIDQFFTVIIGNYDDLLLSLSSVFSFLKNISRERFHFLHEIPKFIDNA